MDAGCAVVEVDGRSRDGDATAGGRRARSRHDRARMEHGLPVRQVVCAEVGRAGPAITRVEVFEELDAGARLGAQAPDAQVGAEDGVQVLLLGAVVLALSGDPEPEGLAVEAQAACRCQRGSPLPRGKEPAREANLGAAPASPIS